MKEMKSIGQRFSEAKGRLKNVKKRKRRYRFSSALFLITSFFLMGTIIEVSDAAKQKFLDEYLSSTDAVVLNSLYDNQALRGNIDALEWYEENLLGIDNNTALAGFSWNCGANMYNRNQIGEIVAYRDRENGKLVVERNGQELFVSTGQVSEIIATEDCVYYIDFDSGNFLLQYDIKEDRVNEYIPEYVCQFALYGNQIFYLTNTDKVIRYSIQSGEKSLVATNTQRFFISDCLLAQSGEKIFSVKLDGGSHTELISNAFLVGVDGKKVYYTSIGSSIPVIKSETADADSNETADLIPGVKKNSFLLYMLDRSTGISSAVSVKDRMIRSVYINGDQLQIDIVD